MRTGCGADRPSGQGAATSLRPRQSGWLTCERACCAWPQLRFYQCPLMIRALLRGVEGVLGFPAGHFVFLRPIGQSVFRSRFACLAAVACRRLSDRVRLPDIPPLPQGSPHPRQSAAARALPPVYRGQQIDPGRPRLLLLQYLSVRPGVRLGAAVIRSRQPFRRAGADGGFRAAAADGAAALCLSHRDHDLAVSGL
jgi:hypothetical protein